MSVSFENAQWRVTADGMESVDPRIVPPAFIERNRFFQTRAVGDEVYYEWPLHMAEKSWVDLAAFEQAFRVACSIDPVIAKRSFDKAREIKAKEIKS
jgi:hypothetical protein